MEPESAPTATRFVKHYSGAPMSVILGPATTATADLGTAIVTGRPYPLSEPLQIDPDGPEAGIRRALRNLDGRFSLLAVGARRAVLATDALGSEPAYLTERAGTIIVASHLGCLARSLGRPLEIDQVGAVATLAGSLSVAGSTPYRGVRRLRACEYVIIDLASGSVERTGTYGTVADIFEVDHESPGSAADLADLLRAAVDREVGADGLFLSAGKDSQAVALSIPPERRGRILAMSYGGWRSTDRRGSVGEATAYGLRHRLLPPLRLHLEHYVEPIISIGGGSSGLQSAQHVAGARAARSHCTVALHGYLGDVLSGKNSPMEVARQWDAVWNRHAAWLTRGSSVLTSAFPDELAAIGKALQHELEQYLDLPPGRPFTVTNLTHRQASLVWGTVGLMHQETEIATPFFSRPLIHYLLTRKADDLAGARLYRGMLSFLGYTDQRDAQGWVGTLAQRISRRQGSYLTVNWPAVIRRSRPWLRDQLESHRGERIGRLAYESLDSNGPLPVALFALPILETAHPSGAVEA